MVGNRVEMSLSRHQFIEFHEFLCAQFGWLHRGSVGLSSKIKHSVLASGDNRGGDPRVAAMLVHCFGMCLVRSLEHHMPEDHDVSHMDIM